MLSIKENLKWGILIRDVLCHECGKTITERDDLYTYLSMSGIHGLCSDCYMSNQKTLRGVRTPINSQATVFVMIVAIIACALLFMRYRSLVWIIIALFTPVIRFLSWVLIERKLKY